MATKNKSCSIYNVLNPVYYIFVVLGITPFKYNREKQLYQKSKLTSAYCIIVSIIFAILYVIAMAKQAKVWSFNINKVTNCIDILNMYSGVVVMVFAIVLNVRANNDIIYAVKQINEIDQCEIIKEKCSFYNTKLRNTLVATVIYFFLALAVLEFIDCHIFLNESNMVSRLCWFLCYIPVAYSIGQFLVFVTFVKVLKDRYSILNAFLKKNIYCPREFLIKVRKIHAKLCHVHQKVQNSYSLQILLMLSTTFVSFTTHAYYSFMLCLHYFLFENVYVQSDLVSTILWTISKLVQIAILGKCCESSTMEAWKTVGLLYKLENRFEVDISPEILLFSNQVLHWDPKYTACGLFRIDMTLFTAVICSASTYITILMQLEQNLLIMINNSTSVSQN